MMVAFTNTRIAAALMPDLVANSLSALALEVNPTQSWAGKVGEITGANGFDALSRTNQTYEDLGLKYFGEPGLDVLCLMFPSMT